MNHHAYGQTLGRSATAGTGVNPIAPDVSPTLVALASSIAANLNGIQGELDTLEQFCDRLLDPIPQPDSLGGVTGPVSGTLESQFRDIANASRSALNRLIQINGRLLSAA